MRRYFFPGKRWAISFRWAGWWSLQRGPRDAFVLVLPGLVVARFQHEDLWVRDALRREPSRSVSEQKRTEPPCL